MDHSEKDWTLDRAMALALMRQALDLLEAAHEQAAASHLRNAVEAMLRRAGQAMGSPDPDVQSAARPPGRKKGRAS